MATHNQMPLIKQRMIVAIAILCLIFMTPFVLNNFIQGRLLVGILSFIILAILLINAICILKFDRYYDNLVLLMLIPVVIWFLHQSITSQGIIGVLWTFPAVYSFYILLPGRKAWLANALLFISVLMISYAVFDNGLFIRIAVTLLLASIFSALFMNLIENQNKHLMTMATTDALTNLLNRTVMPDALQEAVLVAKNAKLPMCLLTLDLDNFKSINDNYGHAVGDTVLKSVAENIQSQHRLSDKLFRYGGEEFLLLLYNTDSKAASRVAEKIRTSIAGLEILQGEKITVSIGVAEYKTNETWSQWMSRSDENLYLAKKRGRNRVAG